jgi:ornithine--oxo-acid transaminase
MDDLTLTSRAFYNDKLGPWTQYVTEVFNFDRAIFANAGVEACETAVKFARRWAYDVKGVPADQARVLFANDNFWGRSLAACGSSNDPDRYRNFGPFQGMGFDLIDYNDVEALD